MAVGKISGPLLKENLLRDGVDLAFETDLIYLDVNNRRVGIKTSTPSHDLTVNGTTRTTNLEVTNTATIGNVVFSGDQIYSNTGTLNLATSGIVQVQSRLIIDDLKLEGNAITNINPASPDINITANGSGDINLNSNTLVNGNLHATGTITADGNITIGDADTDNVIFNADVASDIIPNVDNTYQLGTASKRWKDLYVDNIVATNVSGGSITVNGIDIALSQGNIYYVATNGNDGNSGVHQNDPLSSVGRALDLASAGDTIYIYPGTYQETLPLVIPAGVTVKGSGIRSVTIEPDSDVTVDMFLLNGETTIEDLTIRGFEFDAATNTGYAFRFAPGFKVTTRSPYIRNLTVITAGSTVRLMTNPVDDPRGFLSGDAGKGAYLDGSLADPTSNEASCLFHSVTFICPGVDAITAINGVRVEWLNCFTYFADRGLYLLSGNSGFASDGKTRIKITNKTGTFNVGNTLSYYDTDGTTVLASGVIESIDGDFYVIDGKAVGFETPSDRPSKTIVLNGDAKLSTAQKKFGSASLVVDGVGDYITVASQPDFAFGTADFTLDLFWRPNALGTQQVLLDMRTATTDVALYLEMNTAGNIRLFVNGAYRITSSVAVTAASWNHITLFRTSGVTKLAINGTITPTTYSDSNNYGNRPFRIGANWVGSVPCAGYFDEVRVVKGAAKYTTSVTVPTAAFQGDSSTVLLLHFDGTNNSTLILDDGITLQDIRTSSGGTASIIDFADYSDFGVELRSIGSANVYGNYGAYGDGEGVLGYLIGQNFAYIGSGRLSNNDPIIIPNDSTNVNEVVQFNRAKIYYTSVDAQGNFKVGDFFKVDQATGEITFSGSNVTFTAPSGIIFTDGINVTEITPTKVETGNIRISGNTIESTTLGITLTAANSQINITSNTDISGDLSVTNNFNVQGSTVLGNSNTDTVTVNASVNSDLIPNQTSVYDIGSPTKYWRNVYLNSALIDDISISGNVIQTVVSNADLELRANGTGIVSIPSDSLNVGQNFTVSGNSTLQNTTITGTLSAANISTNNLVVANTTTIINDIEISGNQIRTTVSNSDLEFTANGVGVVSIPENDVSISQDITVFGTTNLENVNINGILAVETLATPNSIVANNFITDDIQISGNVIRTSVSNSNLELRANGTGIVNIQENAVVDNNLTVNGITSLQNTNVTGTVTANDLITGSITVSSVSNIDSIQINNNTITTTVSNANLELRANGAGIVDIQDSAIVENDLTVNGTTSLQNTNITGTLSTTDLITGSISVSSVTNIDSIQINNNVIRTTVSNANLELRANGTGVINIQDNAVIQNNLTVLGNTSLQGNLSVTGTLSTTNLISSSLSLSGALTIDDIEINGNVIRTTTSNTNLELRTSGTGTIELENFSFNGNVITSTSAQDLEIVPSGTGIVKITSNQALQIPTGSDAQRPLAPQAGMIRFNSTVNQYEGYNGSYWIQLGGVSDVDRNTYIIPESSPGANDDTIYFYTNGQLAARLNSSFFDVNKVVVDNIEINDNIIRTTVTNTNLEFRPNGTGVVVMDNFEIGNNTILNTTSGAVTQFQSTGTGYFQIAGTNAVVIPSGNNSARPLSGVLGMIRWNTDFGIMEAYDGAAWVGVAGVGAGINAAQAQDIALAIVLSLG